MNGGTCVDSLNQWSCNCPATYTGGRCNTDVNECALNNGGCGAVSTCVNFVGGWNCTAYIVPGSLSSPDPVFSASPLVFNSLAGQRLQLTIAALFQAPATYALYLGPAGQPTRHPCANLTAIGVAVGLVCFASHFSDLGI
jgi:hypothetical protein